MNISPTFYKIRFSPLSLRAPSLKMPTTRSSTRSVATSSGSGTQNVTPIKAGDAAMNNAVDAKSSSRKRKAESALVKNAAAKVSKKLSATATEESLVQAPPVPSPGPAEEEDTTFVPAVLTFDLEEAKNHLIQVDHRFEDLFTKMRCKPFQNLEQVHPFR